MHLVNTVTGELRLGRCEGTNVCSYCRTLYTLETVEMVMLDALEWPPTMYAVLTSREHLTRQQANGHTRCVLRALRRRWPVELFTTVEFQKRGALHLNHAIKGVPVEQLDEFAALLIERWCSRVDALPSGQYVGPMYDAGGAIRYMAKMLAHGMKVEQEPPFGWRGHRTSQTRGYLVRPASVMRQEARRSLAIKRGIHRGLDPVTAELEADIASQTEWRLVHLSPSAIAFRPDQLSGWCS